MAEARRSARTEVRTKKSSKTICFTTPDGDEIVALLNRRGRIKQIQINDCLYTVTQAYRAGAQTCADNRSYRSNPHRYGSQRADDWNDGYTNHEGGCHEGLTL